MAFDLDYTEIDQDYAHPLDCVERISAGLHYDFDRCADDRLLVKVHGDYGPYAINFKWNTVMGGLEVLCKTGWRVEPFEMGILCRTVVDINSQLHIGHFNIDSDGAIQFCHTILLRGSISAENLDPVQEIIEIAASTADKFHALFAMIKSGNFENEAALELALSSVEGHA